MPFLFRISHKSTTLPQTGWKPVQDRIEEIVKLLERIPDISLIASHLNGEGRTTLVLLTDLVYSFPPENTSILTSF